MMIIDTKPQTARYDDNECKEYYQSEVFYNFWPSSLIMRRQGTPPVTLQSGFESSLLHQSWNTMVSPMAHHSPSLSYNVPFMNAAPPLPPLLLEKHPSSLLHFKDTYFQSFCSQKGCRYIASYGSHVIHTVLGSTVRLNIYSNLINGAR